MNQKILVECVPNFSEGRDSSILDKIAQSISTVDKVKLLNIDPGKATNRTVVTFVGHPDDVIEAAFQAIKTASELIDMSKHSGEHPRMGATDVCPLIPISGISLAELVPYAQKLAERVALELNIPTFLYEEAATKPDRKNLATIRAGEYEGLEKKLQDPNWHPDYGSAFNAKSGATAIGVRDFLVAYNVNLNTTSVRRANSIAFDIREKGRVKREGNKMSGEILRDDNGEPLRNPGMLKAVKAIGWYIEEYGVAQISMNLTDLNQTSLHEAFEACRDSANKRGMRVTGSELVGLLPKKVLLDAGKFFLRKQKRSIGISEVEIIKIAVKSLGLDELGAFDPQKRVIEYMLEDASKARLVNMKLNEFALETASESPAPGGGSIAAYVGALGTALGTMVANLSSHKRGWDKRWEEFSDWAEKGQAIQTELLALVDKDTDAFNLIIDAIRLPKNTDEDLKRRAAAIEAATKNAIEIPFQVMEKTLESFELLQAMAEKGNPNSASDAGVGALCARAAVHGAHLNVKINMSDLKDKEYIIQMTDKAQKIADEADRLEKLVVDKVKAVIA